MSQSTKLIQYLSSLAYLNPNLSELETLRDEVNETMDFVTALRQVETNDIEPLMHPLDNTQRLRDDKIEPCEDVSNLANNAPLFKDNLYLVPKVI